MDSPVTDEEDPLSIVKTEMQCNPETTDDELCKSDSHSIEKDLNYPVVSVFF